MSEKTEYIVRIAREQDMERLVEIYTPYVLNTNVSFEYEAPDVDEFTKRYRNIIANFPYLVLELDGVIQGYAYANTYKPRRAYDWCVETTIYLDQKSTGKNMGMILYSTLETLLRKQNVQNLAACITCPNSISRKFHEKFGFYEVAHFHKCGYKFGKWHDMIWMEKMIGNHDEPTLPFIPFSECNYTL